MRFFRLLLLFLLLGAVGNVLADRGQHGQRGHFSQHRHGAVIIGSFWGPGWYYPPYPQTIVVQQAVPQVYIEQASGKPVPSGQNAASSNYWYYCAAAKAYYPDVNECPAGWLQVLPQALDQH